MSTSIVLYDYNLAVFNSPLCISGGVIDRKSRKLYPNFKVGEDCCRRNGRLVIANAAKKKKKSWWRRFFLEDDGNWLGLREDDMEESLEDFGKEEDLSDEEKFEAWKKRAEAIIELREAQDDLRNEQTKNWEDWLVFEENANHNSNNNGGVKGEWDDEAVTELKEDDVVGEPDPDQMIPPQPQSERGLVKTLRDMILGLDDDDLLYEDRVFRYASRNSAKFLAILIIIPWALDFLVHDYVLVPFLDRYVKTVPLAAHMLDVRRNQKLEMVKELNTEKARLRFEMEIGKSPPLTDEEMWWELRHKALDLREEWRLSNRKAFANIFSDLIFGISLFVLLYFNQAKVALLKFTGYKVLNNISDTGKAFLIILITDIFLGYHSESGWQTVCEVIVEHYGLEVDQATITIFICFVPVIMDACVKLWLFKFLPSLSPKVSNIFREMKRH